MASFRSLLRFGALGALAFLTLAGCGQSASLEDSPREDTESSATPQAQPLESVVQEVASKLCDQDTYTSRVTNLSCSLTHVTFGSIGLPDNLANVMVGITATNQQYPRPTATSFLSALSYFLPNTDRAGSGTNWCRGRWCSPV